MLQLSFSFFCCFQEDRISYLHSLNVTIFPAVLKKVNKKSFKNKMRQPLFMFYYYIYSIYIYLYINTYINILHVQPILKRKGGKREPKRLMRTWGGGESITLVVRVVCRFFFSCFFSPLVLIQLYTLMQPQPFGGEGKGSFPQFAQ